MFKVFLIKGLLLIIIFQSTTGCCSERFQYVGKAIKHGMGKNDHHKIFSNRTIKKGKHQKWALSIQYGKVTLTNSLMEKIEKTNPIAFLVIKNNEIVFEKYWGEFDRNTISNSFSMAKSIIGILVGIAIDEGKIEGVDQYVSDFLPQFRKGEKEKVKIEHLLTMSSDLDYSDNPINPFGLESKGYYGGNASQVVLNIDVGKSVGKVFKYQNFNTMLLALILHKATGKTVSEYTSEKLWKPLGAERSALWSLDKKDGDELAWCCFYATTRDFARFGQLFLNKGRWRNNQLVSENYVKESISPSLLLDGTLNYEYGYQWWLTKYRNLDVFFAWGMKEQFIAVIPEKQIVFVRLANNLKVFNLLENFYLYIDSALALTNEV